MKQKFTLVLIIAALFFLKPDNIKAQVNVQDSLALVDLYNSTNGAHWGIKWDLNMPVSKWHGITVNNGRVTLIILDLNALAGSIPSSLSNITNLNALVLGNNALSGDIPASLGNLTNLGTLNLALNHLTGSIPPSFANLTSLGYLNLAVNNLTGNIPAWLGNLKSLNYLSLGANQFSGKIPSSLSNLPNLSYLNLAANNLTGNIPSWLSNLIKLDYLSLGTNQFSGKIPSSLSNLTNLSYLNLAANNLTGNIPSWLNNLKNLDFLYLDHNKLTGNINHKLDSLTNLGDLTLNNNQLTGTVPSSFNNLIYLNKLDLSINQLSDKIPSLDNLTRLSELHFDGNQFTFSGMEGVGNTFHFATYANQSNINLQQKGNNLSVAAGGTLSNNTYKWYRNGVLFKTKIGDASLTITKNGNYFVTVINSVATGLTLHSDTLQFNTFKSADVSGVYQSNIQNKISSITVFPNPAKSLAIVLINTSGKYSLTVTDISGKILQAKLVYAMQKSNQVKLDVSKYATGVYFIKIVNENNQQQILKLNKQ